VVAGDGWWKIASKVKVPLADLYAANNASETTPLFAGSTICLPANATDTVPGTTTTTVPAAAPAPTTATTVPGATTTTVPAGTVIPTAAFPVQGPCWFTDTWQAPRGGGRRHEGVDIIARAGLYVYAVADGTLTRQVFDRPGSLSGNAWWLTQADGTYYFYAHLSAFAPDLKVGSKVVAGQILGFIGRTGNAGAAHLHFEVHPGGGAAINPTPTVRATDGCKRTEPLAQPSGTLPPTPSTLPPAGSGPTTTTPGTAPATTAPSTPAPTTTAPVTAPITSVPLSTRAGTEWQYIAPRSIFDSSSSGTVRAQSRQTVRLPAIAGVPSGTGAVMLRITTQGSGAGGFITLHPCDIPPPFVASLTFPPGGTSVGTAAVEVVNGSVCFVTSTAVNVRLEVLGSLAQSGTGVQPTSSIRVLDTRQTGRLAAGQIATLTPAALGVPAGTQALTAVVTTVNPASGGTLSLGFCGQGPWTTQFNADQVASFAITMRPGTTGWCLSSSVATDVVVDIVGRWVPVSAGGVAVLPVDPVRVFDSRTAGTPVHEVPVTVPVAGVGGINPAATTALLTITAVSGQVGAAVFAVPCGEPRPAGVVVANQGNRITTVVVPVRLGAGAVCVSSLNPTHLVIDVTAAG
jgi:hypothetical protein